MLSKLRDSTRAGDDEITRNLVGLARTRPDIFGGRGCAGSLEKVHPGACIYGLALCRCFELGLDCTGVAVGEGVGAECKGPRPALSPDPESKQRLTKI